MDDRRSWNELLERVAAGDLAPDPPEGAERLATRADFERELRSSLAAREELDGLGPERIAVEQDARALPHVPRRAGIHDPVRARARRGATQGHASRPTAGRSMLPVAWVLAAAGLALLLWRPWSGPATGSVDGPLGRITDLSPQGPVAEYGTFTWSCEAGPGDSFVLQLYDAATDKRLLPPQELMTNRWTPDAGASAKLSDSIRWRVRVNRASGEVQAAEAFAQRAP